MRNIALSDYGLTQDQQLNNFIVRGIVKRQVKAKDKFTTRPFLVLECAHGALHERRPSDALVPRRSRCKCNPQRPKASTGFRWNGMSNPIRPAEERISWFRQNFSVPPTNECVTWDASRLPSGYGLLGSVLVHRLSYTAFNGPIPKGMLVRHKCDNPPCYNPRHLELGTSADNMRDSCTRSGRGRKLTAEQARQIFQLYHARTMLVQEIAERFNIHPTVVGNIGRRRRWAWATEELTANENYSKPHASRLRKLTWNQVQEIRDLYAEGRISQWKLGQRFQVAQSVINDIVNFRSHLG